MYNVLHHVAPSGQRAVEECIRVCKPGGIVLIGDFPDADKRQFMWHSICQASPLLKKPRLLLGRFMPKWFKKLLKGKNYKQSGDTFIRHSGKSLKEFFEAKGHQVQLKDQLESLSGSMYRSNLIIRKSGG